MVEASGGGRATLDRERALGSLRSGDLQMAPLDIGLVGDAAGFFGAREPLPVPWP
jgi:hypothetical protein